jgi:hypothetical protein
MCCPLAKKSFEIIASEQYPANPVPALSLPHGTPSFLLGKNPIKNSGIECRKTIGGR